MELRSQREIALMRLAGLVVWKAHQAAAAAIVPGATTRDVDHAVEQVFVRHGAVPLFKGVPGKVPFPAATCVSVNDEVVHGVPGDRVLREGDVVSVDTGCRLGRWCGDSAWTYPVGNIDPHARRLLDTTRTALEKAIEVLATAKRWSQVARAIQATVEGAGYSVVTTLAGHAIGRELHEPPQLPNYVGPRIQANDVELKPGMTIAVEPMVCEGTANLKTLADHWTQATVDGRRAAHFEHTLALTSGRPILLTGPPAPGEPLPPEVA